MKWSVGTTSSSRFTYNQKDVQQRKSFHFFSSFEGGQMRWRQVAPRRGGRRPRDWGWPPLLAEASQSPGGPLSHGESRGWEHRPPPCTSPQGWAARCGLSGTVPVQAVRGHCCSCGRGAASRAPRRRTETCWGIWGLDVTAAGPPWTSPSAPSSTARTPGHSHTARQIASLLLSSTKCIFCL